MEASRPEMRRHTLVVLVEDHPGVLNRVVSLLRRRSFNIDTITVGASEQPGVSRMTLVVEANSQEVEQAGKQLYKLMEVLKVTDITDTNAISHELVLVKVATKAQNRQEVMLAGQIYGAKFVDATPSSLIMEVTGSQERIESFLHMVKPYGIRELVRTGPIAMSRGGGTVQIRDGRIERTNGVPVAAD
jgi:acetolactate synthase I/III small subunit